MVVQVESEKAEEFQYHMGDSLLSVEESLYEKNLGYLQNMQTHFKIRLKNRCNVMLFAFPVFFHSFLRGPR